MTETEKIEYAKSFIDKLANGINPLDDSPIPGQDIVNNVRLSRCFFYVSDILRQVIEAGGLPVAKSAGATGHRKHVYSLTEEERAGLQVSDTPLTVKEIADYLNGIVDLMTTRKVSSVTINKWLLDKGFLEIVITSDGKKRKMPTPQGNDIGIFAEERNSQYGPYLTVPYSSQAQRFIFDHIDDIVNSVARNRVRREQQSAPELQGQPWNKEQEDTMLELYHNGTPFWEIAAVLQRTEGGIRARLKKLGLLD